MKENRVFHGIDTSGLNLSLWFTNFHVPIFPSLTENLAVDVCVIGGGIAGLSIAYNLCMEGKVVCVVEDGKIGSGETGRTTGHLASGIDDRYYKVEQVFGEQGARYAAESHAKAIDTIENIIKKESIDCDFSRVKGYLFLEENDTVAILQKEYDAASRAGLTVEVIEQPHFKGLNLSSSLCFKEQAQFHPLKFIAGLANAITAKGGKVFEKTHAKEIEMGETIKITSKEGMTISAKHVVIATNATIYDKANLTFKQEANRTYVIGALVEKGQIEQAIFWGTGDPYHYIRTHAHTATHDFVSVGGEDHRTGNEYPAAEKFNALEVWAKKHIPNLGKIEYRWSGQVLEPVDHLGFIGRNPSKENNVYLVSGDSGNGLTNAMVASLLIPDMILGRKNPWEEIYNPKRYSFKNMTQLLANNLKGAIDYAKYLTPGEVSDIKDIKPETGAVIRDGLSKVAVYRDKDNKLHQHSAVCPHMGGILCWNATEHSWDCPVHGSRFTVYGEVINGPANKGLEVKQVEIEKE